MTGSPVSPLLVGRVHEQEVLDRLLVDLQCGYSRALVLRGEPGIGKSALLAYLAGQVAAGRVIATIGAESETEIAYSALRPICIPLLSYLDRLPTGQRAALATTLGLGVGTPPGQLLTALAVLGLLTAAAAEQPLVCVVDDVQWIDQMSAAILAFVARRLDTESVALIFAVSDRGSGPVPPAAGLLTGLPELPVDRLCDGDARALLDRVLPRPLPARARDRILARARGNPSALLELARGENTSQTDHPGQ